MLKIIILLAGVLFSLSRLSGQQPANTNGDWVHQLSSDDPRYVRVCFEVADSFMNFEKYDSAQLWLNKIHAVLPFKDNSVNNYFLITRQAEVYYYNNLQQLGLQESRRGLAMAEALNDSLLLADSYNFLGLFYMNIDSTAASIPYYQKGLLFPSTSGSTGVFKSFQAPSPAWKYGGSLL